MMQAQDFPLISHSPKRWAEFVRTRTPILESIVQLDSRKRKCWGNVGNEALVAHAKWKIADEGICGKMDLSKKEQGLYLALMKRDLLDEIGLEDLRGVISDWAKRSDEELVAAAKEFIMEKKVGGRSELRKLDGSLYRALHKRDLLDEVGLPSLYGVTRDWTGFSDEELATYAKGFIDAMGIGRRKELALADKGLYQKLWSKNLLESIGLPDTRGERRDWAGMQRDVLLAYAMRFIAENNITNRGGLEKADSSLYHLLRQRKLLDGLGLRNSNRSDRDWVRMGREELKAYAIPFIAESGIRSRMELKRVDEGLYKFLNRWGLMDDVGLTTTHRIWASKTNTELLKHANKLVAEKRITGKNQLAMTHGGLCQVLRKRGLLDKLFSTVEAMKHAEAVDGVLDALETFGD